MFIVVNQMIILSRHLLIFFSVENILYLFCREQFDTWQLLLRARNEGRLFSKIFWPNDPEMVLFLKKTKNLLAVMLLLV